MVSILIFSEKGFVTVSYTKVPADEKMDKINGLLNDVLYLINKISVEGLGNADEDIGISSGLKTDVIIPLWAIYNDKVWFIGLA